MTRTTDETLSPTERVNRVLNAFGDDSDVLVISNHINAGGAIFLGGEYKDSFLRLRRPLI